MKQMIMSFVNITSYIRIPTDIFLLILSITSLHKINYNMKYWFLSYYDIIFELHVIANHILSCYFTYMHRCTNMSMSNCTST